MREMHRHTVPPNLRYSSPSLLPPLLPFLRSFDPPPPSPPSPNLPSVNSLEFMKSALSNSGGGDGEEDATLEDTC